MSEKQYVVRHASIGLVWINPNRNKSVKSLKNSTFFFLPLVSEFVLTGGMGHPLFWFLITAFLASMEYLFGPSKLSRQ